MRTEFKFREVISYEPKQIVNKHINRPSAVCRVRGKRPPDGVHDRDDGNGEIYVQLKLAPCAMPVTQKRGRHSRGACRCSHSPSVPARDEDSRPHKQIVNLFKWDVRKIQVQGCDREISWPSNKTELG
ncbi:hypothetical protein HHI36_017377 [Cryptolaemus montrouzieri]|uniref:Uncharacterized protein n=1 Tax=Cryptolaemus montrouzieri TaxID=559131 RepID=A0ABD2NMC1_9CUCU